MNKAEAKAILDEHLGRYRVLTYEDLTELIGSVETDEVKGASGTTYQLEFQAVWDDRPNGDVRVMASIDDGGLRAFFPMTADFIKAPNGGFVDE